MHKTASPLKDVPNPEIFLRVWAYGIRTDFLGLFLD